MCAPSTPFDELARNYDASFTNTALGRTLRTIVWDRIANRFRNRTRILEIGCGTGEDAIHLATRNHDVVATDPSPAMLTIARDKAERTGVADRIEFRQIGIDRLGPKLTGERFDGVLSNFGALNCATDFRQAARDLAAMLGNQAPIVLVIMGRWVPWEWAWYLARLESNKAFRRLQRNGATWRGLQIRYPSPGQLTAAFSPEFRLLQQRALGLLLPPTYASKWLERRPRTLQTLAGIENKLARWQALASLSDHYIVEAERSTEAENSQV